MKEDQISCTMQNRSIKRRGQGLKDKINQKEGKEERASLGGEEKGEVKEGLGDRLARQ